MYFVREKYLSRIRPFYSDTELIKVLTGVRRCGKSTILNMVKDELIKSGVNEKNIIYISLDKRPYRSIENDKELEKIIDDKTANADGKKFLFIDEVQRAKGFESLLDALRQEDYSIFITGSNSYLLSGELTTYLTGRYIEFEIQTLSFDEYCQMKEFYKGHVNYFPENEFKNYILEGGFPYAVTLDSQVEKELYVKSVVDEIYLKDIKQNRKIRNKEQFLKVQQYIINNFGCQTSIDALCKSFITESGKPLRRATMYNYLKILEDAHIISRCRRFDLKSKKSIKGEEKYYLSDLSFYFAQNINKTINYGPVLENIFYNYLKSKNYEASIGKIGNLEVDFIIRNRLNNGFSYAQIALTIFGEDLLENGISKVEEREYRSLEKINDFYPKYVFTLDKLQQQRSGIKHLNICDFMYEGKELD